MSYCDSLIAANISQNCENPLVAGVEREGVIINRSDIDFAASVVSGNKITTLALKSGKKGFKITQPAAAPFSGTSTTLTTGTYYNSWTHNVGFVVLDNTPDVCSKVIDGLANGSFVVVLENKTKSGKDTPNGQEFQVYGWHQGLKASEISEEKYSEDTDGGWAVTMTESKSPLSAVFFSAGSYASTKSAFDSLVGGGDTD